MTDKIDFKRTLDAYQVRRQQIRIVDGHDLQEVFRSVHVSMSLPPQFARTASYPRNHASEGCRLYCRRNRSSPASRCCRISGSRDGSDRRPPD
jgi:hypothetical protein